MPLPVLHCYGDYKWTGPSGPVARLGRRLTDAGWRADLACIRPPDEPGRWLATNAREMGLRVLDGFHFDSSPNLRRNLADVRRLRRLVDEGGYGLVHCHGTWDHALCAFALRGRRERVPLVRTDHRGRHYRRNALWRAFYGPRALDRLLVLSDRFAVRAVELMGLDAGFVRTVHGAVDAEDFGPFAAPPGKRTELGLSDDDVVLGVVARVQPHRRFDVLLEAALKVQGLDPRVKIAVCGRGTHKERILDRPVARMGLERTVFPLGYRREDYRDVLATFDAGIMLVPGSDGSCRAAMEMCAMEKPLVVAERGVLPDIVRDGETGIVVKDEPDNLAEAILLMAADEQRRRRWGRAARRRMIQRFSPERQAQDVITVYEELLEERNC
ncbi:MAG: glycosyltransferase family 4 protein [Candidatus Brocadiia bacterium]